LDGQSFEEKNAEAWKIINGKLKEYNNKNS